MNFASERSLAVMSAEDGDFYDADESLTRLIERVEDGLRGSEANSDMQVELCRCLLDRSSVRYWAVRPAEALADLAQAEPIIDRLKPLNRRLLGLRVAEMRTRLYGAPYSPVHNEGAARAALAEMRALIENPPDMWMADVTELRLAQYSGDWRRVVELAAAALGSIARAGMARGTAALKLQAARAWLELDQRDRAADYAEDAYAFFAREGPPDIAAGAAIAAARVRGATSGWPQAEEALAAVEQLTRAQRSLFDQQRYLVEKLQIYDDAFGLALTSVAAGDAAGSERGIMRAWQVAERAKSFSLRQAMTQGGWLRAIDPESAEELAKLDRRLEVAETGRDEASQKEQADLATQRQRLMQAAMERNPLVAKAHAAPDFSLEQLLRALPIGVGLVSWYWSATTGGARLHIFCAGDDRVPRHFESVFTQADIAALEAARRRPAQARNPLFLRQLLSAEVGDRLLPPEALRTLEGCDALTVTPHRYLRQLPLHAMELSAVGPNGQAAGLLVERFAVQALPTLALPFPPPVATDGARRVLLLGCQQDGFHSPPLKDVPLELESLAGIWKGAPGASAALRLMGERDRLSQCAPLDSWGDFDVIHLACHGRFIADSPLDTSLYLGGQALRASEFFGVRLKSDVVCFSACDVGQQIEALDGLAVTSDEWVGLSLPLFQSGARTLLFSLWEANSEIAREFMATFHAALARGLDPPQAHRQACLPQIASERPYGFWANWQLAGFPFVSVP